jgi:hypothetical protein
MGIFVPLYGPFRTCLKRVVPAHRPRLWPKPGPALKYFGLCRAWTVLFSVLRASPSCPAQMYTYIRGPGHDSYISIYHDYFYIKLY